MGWSGSQFPPRGTDKHHTSTSVGSKQGPLNQLQWSWVVHYSNETVNLQARSPRQKSLTSPYKDGNSWEVRITSVLVSFLLLWQNIPTESHFRKKGFVLVHSSRSGGRNHGAREPAQCSCTGPGFSTQRSHQVTHKCLSIWFQGIRCPFLTFLGCWTYVVHKNLCGHTCIHIKNLCSHIPPLVKNRERWMCACLLACFFSPISSPLV